MNEEINALEERAELARAQLDRRLNGFSKHYSLGAFLQAGRQVGDKKDFDSVPATLSSITKNPASSALLALAAGQLFRSGRRNESEDKPEKDETQTDIVAQQLDDMSVSANRISALAWARQHPVLSSATALAIGIGAGYLLINGRGAEARREEPTTRTRE